MAPTRLALALVLGFSIGGCGGADPSSSASSAPPAPTSSPSPAGDAPRTPTPQGDALPWGSDFGEPVGAPVVDDHAVYCLAVSDERYDGVGTLRVVRVDKTGATPAVALATLPDVQMINFVTLGELAVVNGRVVFTSSDYAVSSVPVGGGAVSSPAVAIGSVGFVSDADAIYFASSTIVRAPVPFGGAPPTSLFAVPDEDGNGRMVASMGATAGAVAFVTTVSEGTPAQFAASTSLVVVPADGSSPTTIASGRSVGDVALDADRVYWVDDTGSIVSAPRAGGDPTTLVSGASGASRLRVVGDMLYWEDDTGVRRVRVTGGEVQTVIAVPDAKNWYGGIGFAADATSVYWNDGQGSLRRVTP